MSLEEQLVYSRDSRVSPSAAGMEWKLFLPVIGVREHYVHFQLGLGDLLPCSTDMALYFVPGPLSISLGPVYSVWALWLFIRAHYFDRT